ncbi:LD-carboxypeptidase [Acinetobacter qingfengensis]|uniref:LD-carboxypeptidase n=1 Tax=Acinetobacter qingfengensis TaxID=1262585 RepID=A0A1E7QXL7_9GAMM|nr:LD-carboxypeptidase [Acinetobacter qingfengensis]KAA8731713.1 LD-carboxypeptidase [Acinetobacter qingfengensis]OEY91812.1 LD-carboxypeptidase [Acinetobacter qingfengensis]
MHIRVLAPSACVDIDPIQQAKQHVSTLGIQVSFARHLEAQHRYLAGTSNERLTDLKTACEDKSIDAIWCARGGTGAGQLLPYLDTWLLNKALIGYSDSTVLLNYIAMQGGQAIHGPVFQEISQKNLLENQPICTDAQEVLTLLNPLLQHDAIHYDITLAACSHTQPITLSGKILGGNLSTLCSVQGTPWALHLKQPSILLLEDVGESYYRLERLLVQLLQSIDINHLEAIILGDFYHCPQRGVPQSIAEIFAEHLNPLQIPLYVCSWFGHGEKNRPFWIGKNGNIQKNQLIIYA